MKHLSPRHPRRFNPRTGKRVSGGVKTDGYGRFKNPMQRRPEKNGFSPPPIALGLVVLLRLRFCFCLSHPVAGAFDDDGFTVVKQSVEKELK